jgi:hypothetical protein
MPRRVPVVGDHKGELGASGDGRHRVPHGVPDDPRAVGRGHGDPRQVRGHQQVEHWIADGKAWAEEPAERGRARQALEEGAQRATVRPGGHAHDERRPDRRDLGQREPVLDDSVVEGRGRPWPQITDEPVRGVVVDQHRRLEGPDPAGGRVRDDGVRR